MSFGLNSRVRQRRRRRKLFKSKAVSCQVDKNTGTDILRFFCCPGGILETRKLFLWHILLKTPYIHICPCSWALGIYKTVGIRTYFGSVTAESVRFFHHFAICIKVPRLATFFIVPAKCIFSGAFFEPLENSPFGVQRVQLPLRWRHEQGLKKLPIRFSKLWPNFWNRRGTNLSAKIFWSRMISSMMTTAQRITQRRTQKNATRHICHISGKNVTLSLTKIFF